MFASFETNTITKCLDIVSMKEHTPCNASGDVTRTLLRENSLGYRTKKCNSILNETKFPIRSFVFTLEVLGRHSNRGSFINRQALKELTAKKMF